MQGQSYLIHIKNKDADKLEEMMEAIDTFTKATHTFNIQWNGKEWYAWFRVGNKMLAETLKELTSEKPKESKRNGNRKQNRQTTQL